MEPDVSTWESLQQLLEEDIIWQKQELQRWEKITGDHATFEIDVGQYQMSLLQAYLQFTLCARDNPILQRLPVRFGHMAIGISNPVQVEYPLARIDGLEDELLSLRRIDILPMIREDSARRNLLQEPRIYILDFWEQGAMVATGSVAQVCQALEELVVQSADIAESINRAKAKLSPRVAVLQAQVRAEIERRRAICESDPFEE